MGFCSCTVKFLMVVFNLACAVAGLAILVAGVISNNNGGSFKALISGQVSTVSIALMVIGAIVFLIAFFGCCGALREDTCMIQTYGVILLIILIIEVAIGITAFVYKGKVVTEIDKEGHKFFQNYTNNSKSIDEIQEEFKCCGYKGPSDFTKIPLSCCKKGATSCDQTSAFHEGCREHIKDNAKKILTGVGGVAIGIAVVELLGVICAFYVASSIRNEQRRGYA